jgi:hypothetical protein
VTLKPELLITTLKHNFSIINYTIAAFKELKAALGEEEVKAKEFAQKRKVTWKIKLFKQFEIKWSIIL